MASSELLIPRPAVPGTELDAESIAKNYQNILEGKTTLAELSGYDAAKLEAVYQRGYQAWNAGEWDDATADFAFLALQQPMERRYLFAFACALQHQGEYRHALTFFGCAAAMQASDPFAPFHIAACLLALDEAEAARDALDAVIALCYGQADVDSRYQDLRLRAQTMLTALNC